MSGTTAFAAPVRVGDAAVGHVSVDWDGETMRVTFSVQPGHLPRAAREALVNVAFGAVPARAGQRVQASLPLGDVDLLTAVTKRVSQPHVRAAGGSCLIDATLAQGPAH